jgi:hypothetical protein
MATRAGTAFDWETFFPANADSVLAKWQTTEAHRRSHFAGCYNNPTGTDARHRLVLDFLP